MTAPRPRTLAPLSLRPLLCLPLLCLASSPVPDIAPVPTHRTGHTLAATTPTQVAMASEVVDLTLHPDHADVQVRFEMVNRGDREETLDVGFPTQARPLDSRFGEAASQRASGFENAFLYAFEATVDGEAVEHRKHVLQRAPQGEKPTTETSRRERAQDRIYDSHRNWVIWPMQFAPGASHEVVVRYQVTTRDDAYLEPPSPLRARELLYVLQTGAAWHGPIGSATVRLHLADGIEPEQVELCEPAPRAHAAAEGGPAFTWELRDFEPDQDIRIRYRCFRDAEQAVPQLRRELEADSAHQLARLQLAQNLDSLGEHVAAAREYAALDRQGRLWKTVRSRLHQLPVAWHVGRCLMVAGEAEAAERHLQSAQKDLAVSLPNYVQAAERARERLAASPSEPRLQQRARYLDERLRLARQARQQITAWLRSDGE